MTYPYPVPPKIRGAVGKVLAYALTDEAADFEAKPPEQQDGHIYPSLLALRQWLDVTTAGTGELDTLAIHDLLEAHGYCAAIWCVEDVQSVRDDLTDEQCREVLRECHRRHDATLGINWDVISCIADCLFPPPR